MGQGESSQPARRATGTDAGERAVVRPAARVLLIDGESCLLLFRAVGDFVDGPAIWITPGGGLRPGESYLRAAKRELWEETGVDAEPDPWVWTRRHIFTFNGHLLDVRERFYVVRIATATVSSANWEAYEHEFMTDHRWWSLDELRASSEVFAPRRLVTLLPPLLAGDYPSRPLDVGV